MYFMYFQLIKIMVLLHFLPDSIVCEENATFLTEETSTAVESTSAGTTTTEPESMDCNVADHPYMVSMVAKVGTNFTRRTAVLLSQNWVLSGNEFRNVINKIPKFDYITCRLLMDSNDERFPYGSSGSDIRLYEIRVITSRDIEYGIAAYYFAPVDETIPEKPIDAKKFVKLPPEKNFRFRCETVTVLGIGNVEGEGSKIKDESVPKLLCPKATFVECVSAGPNNCLKFVNSTMLFCPIHLGLPVVCDETILGFVQSPKGVDCQAVANFIDLSDYMTVVKNRTGLEVPFESLPPGYKDEREEKFQYNGSGNWPPTDDYADYATEEPSMRQLSKGEPMWAPDRALGLGAVILLYRTFL